MCGVVPLDKKLGISTFVSCNEILEEWLYCTYVRVMGSNMTSGGIPSHEVNYL